MLLRPELFAKEGLLTSPLRFFFHRLMLHFNYSSKAKARAESLPLPTTQAPHKQRRVLTKPAMNPPHTIRLNHGSNHAAAAI